MPEELDPADVTTLFKHFEESLTTMNKLSTTINKLNTMTNKLNAKEQQS